MKKLSLLLLTTALSTLCLAQGFYFRAGLGYALPMAGQTLDGTGTPYNGSMNYAVKNYNIKGASFSAGVQTYADFGYMVGKHVGAQIGMNIGLLPRKYTYHANNVTFGSGVQGNVTIEQKALLPIFITPAIMIQSGGDKVNLFSRFGPVLPLSKDVTYDQIQENGPNTGAKTKEDYTFTIQNSFSVGFAAGAGVEYKLGKAFSLWAELSMLSLSLYTKHSELTAVTVNGQSYPVSSVSGAPPVNYTRSGVIDSTGTTQPAYSQPFSNFGFNVGIKINMSRRGRATQSHSEGARSRRPAPVRFQ